ncbi:hypothetical protein JQ554_13635 [Bradyrhizobium diazoefficiens]|nr:hypothetical protein [Bradyrhizobium diazoefficiens]MBR0964786.1 hypothetical protein [Bradyrhizobium diazoefficiens]MBR0978959.1 hypothetical protein [Bradyrhizobium diazoefficiens]MBR1006773.1 hypothetical protein [Bradyrhizobium diazoefficiens]MBR1014371.1 hypothetical protein [Bradyrhizobium diazoefficiens]MBR1051954.1 hypothetical protein [Bradyrhizobium diazoefficiens]
MLQRDARDQHGVAVGVQRSFAETVDAYSARMLGEAQVERARMGGVRPSHGHISVYRKKGLTRRAIHLHNGIIEIVSARTELSAAGFFVASMFDFQFGAVISLPARVS